MKNLLLAFAFIGFMVTSYASTSIVESSNDIVLCDHGDKCDKKGCKHDSKKCSKDKKACCKKEKTKKACCKKDAKKSCTKKEKTEKTEKK